MSANWYDLTNYKLVLFVKYDSACEEAEKGLRVIGSEIVGLIPYQAIENAGKHYLKMGKSPGMPQMI